MRPPSIVQLLRRRGETLVSDLRACALFACCLCTLESLFLALFCREKKLPRGQRSTAQRSRKFEKLEKVSHIVRCSRGKFALVSVERYAVGVPIVSVSGYCDGFEYRTSGHPATIGHALLLAPYVTYLHMLRLYCIHQNRKNTFALGFGWCAGLGSTSCVVSSCDTHVYQSTATHCCSSLALSLS
jgi:hypothetical protein